MTCVEFAASLYYNHKKYTIVPGEHRLDPALTAELRCCAVGEGIRGKLFLRNTGDVPSGQIRSLRTLDTVIRQTGVRCHGLYSDSCGANSFLPCDFAVMEPYHEEPLGGRSSAETGFPFLT